MRPEHVKQYHLYDGDRVIATGQAALDYPWRPGLVLRWLMPPEPKRRRISPEARYRGGVAVRCEALASSHRQFLDVVVENHGATSAANSTLEIDSTPHMTRDHEISPCIVATRTCAECTAVRTSS